jgi:hypothetical protein
MRLSVLCCCVAVSIISNLDWVSRVVKWMIHNA